MIFKQRPKFTPIQRLQLVRLIHGELEYVNQDVPGICLFDNEQEAEALLEVIKANSEPEEKSDDPQV